MRPQNKWFSRVILGLCLMLSSVSLGCRGIEPNEVAYVLILGVDRGETNLLRLTYLIANTLQFEQSGGGTEGGKGGGGAGRGFILTTVESPSIYTAADLVNTYTGRRISLIHLKGVTFSEELASDGTMAKFVAAMPQFRELRRDVFLGVTRGKAEDAVGAIKPLLELNPAKYVEVLNLSSRYSSVSPMIQMKEFYVSLSVEGVHPVSNLVAASPEKLPPDRPGQGQWQSEGSYMAGTLPKQGGFPFQVSGAAAFRHGKMVGELNIEETIIYNMFRGKFNRSVFSMPDPISPRDILSMDVWMSGRPSVKVSMTEKGPVINARIKLAADLLGNTSHIDFAAPANRAILERAVSVLMEERARDLVKRCQEEFQADILGFGLYARRLVWTNKEWRALNWDSQFQRAVINVAVDFKISHTGLFYKVMPVVEPERGIQEGENPR